MSKEFFTYLEEKYQNKTAEGVNAIFSLINDNKINYSALQMYGREKIIYMLEFLYLFIHLFAMFYVIINSDTVDFAIFFIFYILFFAITMGGAVTYRDNLSNRFKSNTGYVVLFGMACPFYTIFLKPKQLFQTYFYEYKKALIAAQKERFDEQITKAIGKIQ